MGSWLKHIFHPERYHGEGRKPPFFEGWYFKLVDAAGENRYAIIPGIFLSDQRENHHAFIQVLNGSDGTVAYHRFPTDRFTAARDRFEVRIGENLFSSDRITLVLSDDEGVTRGDIGFSGRVPWPVTLRAPGIMGWYAWVPMMECYHGVLSMDHALEGILSIGEREVDFRGGRGYIEKDWGKSFPAGWVWMQTNHFEEPGLSLSASIAIIPWLRGAFPGFIIGLLHRGHLYRFATWTGARTEHLELTDDTVDWVVADRHLRLQLHGRYDAGGLLFGPGRDRMHERVNETMTGLVRVRLAGRDGAIIFEGTGHQAGIEVQGDLDRLLALQRSHD